MSEVRPSAAAVIAVSGERRSWDTERSSVVLTTFERRSALVSITCDSSSSRRRTAATSVSRPGTTRSCSASSTSRSVSAGTSTVPIRLPSTIRGTARRRESLSTQLSSMATEGSSRACAMRWPAALSEPSTLSPPSRRRAISADRSASRRRRSASSARERASPARVLTTPAATRNTTSATQFSPSAIESLPVGGMWKKFQASAPATAVGSPSQSPQLLATSRTARR